MRLHQIAFLLLLLAPPSPAQSIPSLDEADKAMHAGQPQRAEAIFRAIYEADLKNLGPENDATLDALSGVAAAVSQQGRLVEGEDLYWRCYEAYRKLKGTDSLETMDALGVIAELERQQGKPQDAERMLKEVYPFFVRKKGPTDTQTLYYELQLGQAIFDQARVNDAEPLIRHAYEQLMKKSGERNSATQQAMELYSEVLNNLKRPKEAEALLKRLHTLTVEREGPYSANALFVTHALASTILVQNRYGEAVSLLRPAYEDSLAHLGSDHAETRSMLVDLAQGELAMFHFREAETHARLAYDQYKRLKGYRDPATFHTFMLLLQTLMYGMRLEEVEAYARREYEAARQKEGADSQAAGYYGLMLGVILKNLRPRDPEGAALMDNGRRVLLKVVEDEHKRSGLTLDVAELKASIEGIGKELDTDVGRKMLQAGASPNRPDTPWKWFSVLSEALSAASNKDPAEAQRLAIEARDGLQRTSGYDAPYSVIARSAVAMLAFQTRPGPDTAAELETRLSEAAVKLSPSMPRFALNAMVKLAIMRFQRTHDYQNSYANLKTAADLVWQWGAEARRTSAGDTDAGSRSVVRDILGNSRSVFESQLDCGWSWAHSP